MSEKRYWQLEYRNGTARRVWAEFADVTDAGALVFINVRDPTSQDPSKKFDHVYKTAPGTWSDVINITEGIPDGLLEPRLIELGRAPNDVLKARRKGVH